MIVALDNRKGYWRMAWIASILCRTLKVRPPARLKGERNEIEKLLAGWRVTTCSHSPIKIYIRDVPILIGIYEEIDISEVWMSGS